MEEKLVKVLLAQYKEKGIDMYALLDDKFFMDLTLQQKVDLIKQHAAEISAGTNRALTKKDIAALVLDAGFAGLGSGYGAVMAAKAAHSFFHEGKGLLPKGAIAGAATLGAAVAAGTAYMGSRKRLVDRKDLLNKIKETVENPSDENALRVLTTRNHHFNPPSSGTFSSSALKDIGSAVHNVPNMILEHVPDYVVMKSLGHNFANNPAPFAEGHSVDTLEKAYADSMFGLINKMKESPAKAIENLLKKK